MIKHFTRVDPREWPAEYFTPRELACRGSGMVCLTPAALDAIRRLDALRKAMGHPLIVNSAYRSPAHNRAVGGARQSKHMEGIAFDVSMANVDPHRFEAEARRAGFSGIGLYPPQKPTGAKNFIHIDTRTGSGWRGADWGEFPKREVRFAPEPVPQPVREIARDAGPLVGAGATIMAVAEAADPALREVAPFLPAHWQGYVFAALAFTGVALAVWRVLGGRNRGE